MIGSDVFRVRWWVFLALVVMWGEASGQSSELRFERIPSGIADNSLTLFVYPATVPLNYRSPASLLWSMAANELGGYLSFRRKIWFHDDRGRELFMKIPYRSIIGHTVVCVSCILPDGSSFSHWASMSSYDYTGQALHMFLYEKRGMAMLFHHFTDGRVLRGQENVLRLVNYHGGRFRKGELAGQRKEPRYISFGLTAEQCAAAREFILFFETMQYAATAADGTIDPSRPEDLLYFSSVLDPYESYRRRTATGKGQVGGGCAPFGVSLLKVTGHFDPGWDSLWRRPFHVSEDLMGGFEKKVSPWAMLFGRTGRHWINKDTPVRSVEIYDPGLIWEFIGQETASGHGEGMVPSGTNGSSRHQQEVDREFMPGPVLELRSPELELTGVKSKRLKGKPRVAIQGIRLKGGAAASETVEDP